MQNYYVRFGRRHGIPSTAEILDELRSDYVPGYVRKSWAQFGFTKPGPESAEPMKPDPDPPGPACMTQAEPIQTRSSPLVYPRFAGPAAVGAIGSP
jgi:hypothetical protein